jgi:DNA-binding transcriptional LysR family regulator
MNIVSLHTFIAIVDSGSLVRASEKMNVTQSTVTARLKGLEQELGQVLVNRQKSGTTLTPAGAKLLGYARVMTGLWRQAKAEAGLPADTDSLCTFGCHNDLWRGPGKTLFDAILAAHPQMAMSVHQGSQHELQDWLASGLVDVIVAIAPFSRSGQTVIPLSADNLALFADQPDASISFNPTYVFVDYGPDYRREHAQAYYAAGTARIAFDAPGPALEYLLDHGGSAYLPDYYAAPHVQAGALHAIDIAPVFQRQKYLIVNDAAQAKWPWLRALASTL